ncbi:MAG: fibronectin type III domain-containing protein, partial [FCB group bacterium]
LNNLKYASIELSNKHGFASLVADVDAHAATGLALRLVDKDVKQGATYIYKVKVSKQDTTYYIKEATTFVIIGVNQTNLSAPSELKVLENNSKITLFWANSEKEGYTAYNLYRLDVHSNNFVKINKSPILPMDPDNLQGKTKPNNSDIPGSFVDSNLINNITYTYCLRGINMFAEEGECAIIKATPREQKDLSPTKVTVEQIGIKKAKITWDFTHLDSEIEGFDVSRSANFQDGFENLHEKPLVRTQREFIDTTANEEEPYYIVSVIDSAGNLYRSVPRLLILNDTIPPSKPTGFHGFIDTNGIVNLNWDLGPESNIIGYRVFWANDSEHTFLMANKSLVEDTTFQDTVKLNTLSKYIYYKLSSVNKRYIASENTGMIKLKRPDIIPPQKAVFTKFFVTDSSINLSWEPSLSEDAVKQFLMRRIAGENKWVQIAELPIKDRYYSDQNLTDETNYEYSIETIDDSGLKSITNNFIRAKSQKKNKLSSLTDLQADYDKAQNAIILKWNFKNSTSNDNFWFTIYRSYDNNTGQRPEMQLFATAKSSADSFKDKLLIGNGKYRYSVVVSTNSEQSEKSKIVEVEVK